ncbi:sensor histidine kinase [Romboutsia weinsteinii]|uniref:sensor histidine kinase n=1 Tax=Romboutsia weinsteinii TaxID=2020949 RepID=UPI001314C83D|nr:HAMP domain-containing sensor histidine kinase [Romboutsia weinsteinii]
MLNSNSKNKELYGLLLAYLFMLILSIILFEEFNFVYVYYIVFIAGTIIGISSVLICLVCIDVNEGYFYKHLALTFATIGIMNIIYVYLDSINVLGAYNKSLWLLMITCIIEIVSIYFSFKYINKSFNIEKSIILRLTIILVTVFIVCGTNILPQIIVDKGNITQDRLLVQLVTLILYMSVNYYVKNNKYDLNERTMRDLRMYIRLKSLTIFSAMVFEYIHFKIYPIPVTTIYIILAILRGIYYYYIVKICITDIIQRPNKVLYTNLIEEKNKLSESIHNLELKESMAKSRSEVLSNISHELKTPVNVIYSAIQMQNISIEKNKTDDIQKFNGIMRQNCNRLVRLINNFIDCTKFENNNSTVSLKFLNIVSLTENITMSVLPFAQSKKINLVFDTEEEEMFCEVDIEFMERIMFNILSNAIKYNVENGNIYVCTNNAKEFVEIIIKDTGIGIPRNRIKDIFNRYDRVESKETRHKEGTGIGLNIVSQMVNLLNGHIEIDSIENIGTTVKVTIPKSYKIDQEEYIEFNHVGQSIELELSDI